MTQMKQGLLGGLTPGQQAPSLAFVVFMRKPPGVRDAHLFFNNVKRAFRGSRSDLADLLVTFVRQLTKDGDMASAQTLINLALKEQETEPALREALRLAVTMQNFETGVKLAKHLVRWVDTAENNSDLAYCLYRCERLQDAQSAADDALKLDSNCKNALLNRGIIANAQGDAVTAQRCFEKVTGIDPHNFEAWNNLGNILAD